MNKKNSVCACRCGSNNTVCWKISSCYNMHTCTHMSFVDDGVWYETDHMTVGLWRWLWELMEACGGTFFTCGGVLFDYNSELHVVVVHA